MDKFGSADGIRTFDLSVNSDCSFPSPPEFCLRVELAIWFTKSEEWWLVETKFLSPSALKWNWALDSTIAKSACRADGTNADTSIW